MNSAASTALGLVLAGWLATAGPVTAQQPAPPLKFDVVSIKPVPPGTMPPIDPEWKGPVLPGGHYMNHHVNLSNLIGFAFDQRAEGQDLIGMPDWSHSTFFDISARSAPGAPARSDLDNLQAVRQMVRAMLADRFHLAVHQETRQLDVFDLVTGDAGAKLKPASPGENRAATVSYSRISAQALSLGDLAGSLSLFLGRIVRDRTGLTGTYDIDVSWQTLPSDGADAHPSQDDFRAAMATALREQLGLRLVAAKGPVDVLVIDHVEQPSADN